jgi:synaptobrevin family protein YKT6
MTRNGENVTIVDSGKDFSDVSFIYRKSAVEICDLAATNLATSPKPDIRMSAKEKEFLFHLFRKGNAATVFVCTDDYPSRVAYTILNEIMAEYDQCQGRYPGGKSSVIQRGIREYQDPAKADKLTQIQQNLDEIQNIMVQNLEAAIARGESLSQLADKSQQISEQSKLFAREAEKMNRCCALI